MRDKRWEQFISTKLGKLYLTIPFKEIASRYPAKKNNCGAKPIFSLKGGIGLMFIKGYLNNCSDEKIVEQLNFNWAMQLFCDIRLGEGKMIKDRGIISRWRSYLGTHLKEDEIQKVLVSHWSEHIEQQQTNVADATCYESYVRYPTDVKLLWESLQWVHKQMGALCAYSKTPHPRNKYRDIKEAYRSYSRKRRKSHKKNRRLRKRLLYLLNKMLGQISPLIGLWKVSFELGKKAPVKADFFTRLKLIKRVYKQQQLHYDRPDVRIPSRIVSLAKPYLRPIVRGKENKRVEFGKKVHKMMVGGIGFIEHWDYNAFHEGNRTARTIWKHRNYFGGCAHFGGDQIYATNKNRRYCTKNGIFTGFRRKGRAGKNEDQAKLLRSLIAKHRATVLEGSFGNEKNHYGLNKIKARTEHTENAWIFYGMMCANAMKIAKKMNAPP
ncbi:MAG: transposase [Desulfobulbaceae bacterium]|nr:transposase [Desulfobulbaceae bacterium]